MGTVVFDKKPISGIFNPVSAVKDHFDLCIIGAGVTGAALAAYLGRKGLKIALVEKQWEAPDRIVGELLQPDGVRQLELMGLSSVLENIDAQPVNGYAVFHKGDHLLLNYPEKDGMPKGYGLRNKYLLEALRAEVSGIHNVKIFEAKAEQICYEGNKATGVRIKSNNVTQSNKITAAYTVISDGFFSVLRKELHLCQPKVTGFFIGMLLHDTALPFSNYGHVFIDQKAKFLAYPTATNTIRLLIERKDKGPALKSAAMKEWLYENIMTQLPGHMYSAFDRAVEKAAFQMMPSHMLPGKVQQKEGLVLLGDALNMRNPLTGGGMTAGLTDARNLGNILIKIRENGEPKTPGNLIAGYYQQRKENASINILADALNQVFSDPELATACFDYLKRGGLYAEEPLGLLAGLNRDQQVLLRHFFAVALYGASRQIKQRGIAKGFSSAGKMLGRASGILSPLILNEDQGLFMRTAFNIADKFNRKK
ncbi:MAG: FAD-dependent oxidoreductase [Chitinophagales bacterium]